MSVLAPTRRAFAAGALAWLGAGSVLAAGGPAMAAPGRHQGDTDAWTGGVLVDGDGRSFTLGDAERPLTLLKLWAGWCPTCAAELPQLASVAAALGRSVEVVLISHPQWWAADQAAARRRSLPFRLATFAPSTPAGIVQGALLNGAGQYSVPRSLVFRERDHAIVMKREGATDWGSEAAVSQVRNWLR